MKTKIVYVIATLTLLVSSCKKKEMNPDGVNISKAIDSGVLFATWIIDDDDTKKQQQTEASKYFSGKIKPELTFDKKGTYCMKYTSGKSMVTEMGTWTTDANSNQLILKEASTNTQNAFLINQLDEENFVITNVYSGTKTVTNAEGVTSTEQATIKEILYMEDND